MLVDANGLPLAIHVSSANTADFIGSFELLAQTYGKQRRLTLICADQHYAKHFKEVDQWFNIEVEVAKKSNSEKGYIPQKGRLQVEISFAWTNFYRRLSRDYEKLAESSVTFFQLIFIRIILARLER